MENASICLRLTSRQVGVLLRSVLIENEGDFETVFDEQLAVVTVSSLNPHSLSQAELEVKSHIREIENNMTKNASYSLHYAYIPLLCKDKVVVKIRNLEVIFDVRITFTDQYLSPTGIAHVIASLGNLGTQQIKDITVPVGINDSRYNTAPCGTPI